MSTSTISNTLALLHLHFLEDVDAELRLASSGISSLTNAYDFFPVSELSLYMTIFHPINDPCDGQLMG